MIFFGDVMIFLGEVTIFLGEVMIFLGEVSQVQVAGEQAPRNEQGLRAGDLDYNHHQHHHPKCATKTCSYLL